MGWAYDRGDTECIQNWKIGRLRSRWDDNIEMYHREMGCENGKWMEWLVFLLMILNC
jgi:hypothetical protein